MRIFSSIESFSDDPGGDPSAGPELLAAGALFPSLLRVIGRFHVPKSAEH